MASGKQPAAAASSANPNPAVPPAPPSESNLSTTRGSNAAPGKKKRHRAGKKRRNRRQSFAAPSDTTEGVDTMDERPSLQRVTEEGIGMGMNLAMGMGGRSNTSFYRLGNQAGRSNESLASETLLDHRDATAFVRPRRPSMSAQAAHQTPRHMQSVFGPRPTQQTSRQHTTDRSSPRPSSARRLGRAVEGEDRAEDDDDFDADDRTPLIRQEGKQGQPRSSGYGGVSESYSSESRHRSGTVAGATAPRRRSRSSSMVSIGVRLSHNDYSAEDYDVNNPPSIPGTPRAGPHDLYDPALAEFGPNGTNSPDRRSTTGLATRNRDALINIDDDEQEQDLRGNATPGGGTKRRLPTAQGESLRDVCIPFDQITELGDEDEYDRHDDGDDMQYKSGRRRRRRAWPDLSVLEEWSVEEKEQQLIEGIKAKKVNEPLLIGGRLRPKTSIWRREEEEAPFRWTYFNEEFDSSLRSHTISGLQQLGHTFRELFIPDRPEIEESSTDEDDESDYDDDIRSSHGRHPGAGIPGRLQSPAGGLSSRGVTRQSSILDARLAEKAPSVKGVSSGEHTGQNTPQLQPQNPQSQSQAQPPAQSQQQQPAQQQYAQTTVPASLLSPQPRPKRYGPRPVFWLDILQPTWDEMRVLSRAFAIHSLTCEDIMEQEAREKVELFRNYYFVNYRTFEHDEQSEDYLEPVNMYFVVFKGGVISFHFSQMPHPPLVRRRMRQLAEHQYTDSDWIAYAIIDNITDAYAPLIEQIEKDVDTIDDDILIMHRRVINKDSSEKTSKDQQAMNQQMHQHSHATDASDTNTILGHGASQIDIGRDMLLRVGECRKKVMGLYRLLGNKADVIKGLAKRCNEQWQVAPRSDVGLYLGDIQDHIVTMTANLTHYENILSRAHSNYLAQLNMSMNESAERNADVLGKLTVLGTIVLPMNIITGMWGMNVLVPGQDVPSLYWFWGITAGLFAFGVSCFFIAKKVYGIV